MPNNEDLSRYPLGSNAFPVFDKNVRNLDVAVNDKENECWKDRFGKTRRTWHGFEEAFERFLIKSGYVGLGPDGEIQDYAAGLQITERNQVFRYEGELYRAGAALDLPYTTTGDWEAEGSLFVAVGDEVLRQELSDINKGASTIGRGVVSVRTIEDLKQLKDVQIRDDLTYIVQGYFVEGDGGGGIFIWNPSSTKYEDKGLVFKSNNNLDGSFERIHDSILNVNWFGIFSSNEDVSDIVNFIFTLGFDVFFPSGEYYFDSVLTADGINIIGEYGTTFTKGINTLGNRMADFYNCIITRIKFDGNKNNIIGYPGDFRSGSILSLHKTKISNCYFHNSESSCISGASKTDVKISNCYFSNYDDHAVYFSSGSNKIQLSECDFGIAENSGAVIQFRSGCRNILIENCHQDYVSYDGVNDHAFISIQNDTQSHGSTENITIKGCTYNTARQLYFYSDYTNDYIENVIIESCIFRGNNTHPCFNFNQRNETIIKNFTIIDSFFYDYTQANFGSHFSSRDENIKIINSAFRLSGDEGLLNFANSTDTLMEGCRVEGSSSSNSASFIRVATRCRNLQINTSSFIEIGAGSIVGIELSSTAFSNSDSIIRVTGNSFDCTNHVISAVDPNPSPLGRLLYRDNYEISNASDRVGNNFISSIDVINRYRSNRGLSSAITVHNSLID